jgi:hypothetical protein
LALFSGGQAEAWPLFNSGCKKNPKTEDEEEYEYEYEVVNH